MTKHFNKKSLLERRRQLRMKMTEAETMLWGQIRRKQQNIRFLRQYSVDGYVLDFYAPELKLAIELDGEIHFNSEPILNPSLSLREGLKKQLFVFCSPPFDKGRGQGWVKRIRCNE